MYFETKTISAYASMTLSIEIFLRISAVTMINKSGLKVSPCVTQCECTIGSDLVMLLFGMCCNSLVAQLISVDKIKHLFVVHKDCM